jgi:DNA-binding HxlR family transcriptional regulator
MRRGFWRISRKLLTPHTLLLMPVPRAMNNKLVIPMEILKTISYAGTMEVLASLGKGRKRFTEIMFETKLNPGILNRVLKTLISSGIVLKCAEDEGYELTEKGIKISGYILKIVETSGNEKPENMKLINTLATRLEQVKTLPVA